MPRNFEDGRVLEAKVPKLFCRAGIEDALRQRRQLLRAMLPVSSTVILSESFQIHPHQLLKSVRELGLEGIVAKRAESFYEPGKRSRAWLKYKIQQGQELVIGGYKMGNPLESLLIGYYDHGKLIFLDKVRNGLTPWLRKDLYQKLEPLATGICPFANLPERKTRLGAVTKDEMKKCRWVKPELVAQIEFAEWTVANHLRHRKFVGLGEDKEPQEVCPRAAVKPAVMPLSPSGSQRAAAEGRKSTLSAMTVDDFYKRANDLDVPYLTR